MGAGLVAVEAAARPEGQRAEAPQSGLKGGRFGR